MKLRKICATIILTAAMFMCVGCNKQAKAVYSISNGEKIALLVEKDGGYDVEQNDRVQVSKNGQVIMSGEFLASGAYDSLVSQMENNRRVKDVIDGEKDGNQYRSYTYDTMKYEYIVKIKDTDCCIRLTSTKSKAEADEAFSKMTFKKQ